MYNRYIPQSDGSYRRSRIEEQRHSPHRQEQRETAYRDSYRQDPEPQAPRTDGKKHENQNVGGFLKQLLPPNFDTGDLIIVLLLLLLSGDSQEDKTTAMLTLVLYLFM